MHSLGLLLFYLGQDALLKQELERRCVKGELTEKGVLCRQISLLVKGLHKLNFLLSWSLLGLGVFIILFLVLPL